MGRGGRGRGERQRRRGAQGARRPAALQALLPAGGARRPRLHRAAAPAAGLAAKTAASHPRSPGRAAHLLRRAAAGRGRGEAAIARRGVARRARGAGGAGGAARGCWGAGRAEVGQGRRHRGAWGPWLAGARRRRRGRLAPRGGAAAPLPRGAHLLSPPPTRRAAPPRAGSTRSGSLVRPTPSRRASRAARAQGVPRGEGLALGPGLARGPRPAATSARCFATPAALVPSSRAHASGHRRKTALGVGPRELAGTRCGNGTSPERAGVCW
jgi:hypothetical protein